MSTVMRPRSRHLHRPVVGLTTVRDFIGQSRGVAPRTTGRVQAGRPGADDETELDAYRAPVSTMWRSWSESATTPWERWPGPPPVIALWVSAIQLFGTYFATHDQPAATPLVPWGMVLLAIGGAALAFKNRSPIGVLIVVQIVTIAYYVLGFPVDGPVVLALFVALVNAVLKGYDAWPWILTPSGCCCDSS